jgi:anti-sigma regulatory factor (Ser/Thr protein kinase)
MTMTANWTDSSRGHDALLYDSTDDYVGAITSFVQAGLAGGEPVLVGVPFPKTRVLRHLVGASRQVSFVDMADVGRNPARIIPAVRSFVHAQGGRPTRFVGEPTWPGQSPAEVREVILHEALFGRATAGTPLMSLCPYDTAMLEPYVIAAAERVHSHVVEKGERRPSSTYNPDVGAALFATPLPPPPSGRTKKFVFDHDLVQLRQFVEGGATRAGLDGTRLQDLVLAVSEVATNSVVHAGAPGVIRFWHDREAMEVVCDLIDSGKIDEPLVGRHGAYPLAREGWGLWMVNQVCDLVELRSSDWGTNVRLHVSLV